MWKSTKELAWIPAVAEHAKTVAFDLDHTLASPHGLRKFPKDATDWRFLPKVAEVLADLSKTHNIVIFTNQATSRPVVIKKRIENIIEALGVPIQVYMALGYNIFRKPSTGMYDLWKELNPGKAGISLYVGDAAGRKGDFSDSDYGFAKNTGLKFQTPDEYFGWGTAEPPCLKPNPAIAPTPCPTIDIGTGVVLIVGYPNVGQEEIRTANFADWPVCTLSRKKHPAKCFIKGSFITAGSQSSIIDKLAPRKITCIYIDSTMEQAQEMSLYKIRCEYAARTGTVLERAAGLEVMNRRVFYGLRKRFTRPTESRGFGKVITVPICSDSWNLDILAMA